MNEIECETCIKRKTKYCPNSSECYENIDKPYYQNRIMLLEENEQLKGSLQTHEILLRANVEENQQLKKQLKQKENIINKARKYINNNPLYDIDSYENNTYLSGIDDEQTRKELLEILDNKGE